MYYRLSCIIDTGEIRGYQWREIDQETFVAIATGNRPVGDSEAQTRDSSEVDASFENNTVYYGSVWVDGTGWVNTDAETAVTLYQTIGQEQPGA